MAYIAPTTQAELLAARAAHPRHRWWRGATDVGLWVTKQHRQLAQVLDVTRAAELRRIDDTPEHIAIGAAVTLTEAFARLTAQWPSLAEFAHRFAGLPVRNSGTLGAMWQRLAIGDSMPLLIALRAQVVLASQARGERALPLEALYTGYRQNVMAADICWCASWCPNPVRAAAGRTAQAGQRATKFPNLAGALTTTSLPFAWCSTSTSQTARCSAPASARAAWRPPRCVHNKPKPRCKGQPWTEATVQQGPCACCRPSSAPSPTCAPAATIAARCWATCCNAFGWKARAAPRPASQLQATPLEACCETFHRPYRARHRPARPARAAMGQSHFHESARAQVAGAAHYIDDLPEVKGTLTPRPSSPPWPTARSTAWMPAPPGPARRARRGAGSRRARRQDPGRIRARRARVCAGRRAAHRPGDRPGGGRFGDAGAPRRARRQARHHAPARCADGARRTAGTKLCAPPVFVRRGDAATGLAQSAHRMRGAFEVGGQEHFYLEGQIAYALPLEQKQWWIYSSTQHPAKCSTGWRTRWASTTMRSGGVPPPGRRLWRQRDQAGHLAVWAAVAANKLGRPVKLRLDRDEDFMVTGKRHPFAYEYDVGFDDTGRITGLKLQMAANCGFSADLSGPVADRAVFHRQRVLPERCGDRLIPLQDEHPEPHGVPRVLAGRRASSSSKPSWATSPAHWAAMHRTCAWPTCTGAMPARAATSPTTRWRWKTTSCTSCCRSWSRPPATASARPRLLRGTRKAGAQARHRHHPGQVRHQLHGHAVQPGRRAGACVHRWQRAGEPRRHRMGQGLHTKVAQIVADELGVPLHRVLVTASDTSKVPNASATAASSGTDLNGRAAQYAARHVRDNLASFVCGLDGAAPGPSVLWAGRSSRPKPCAVLTPW